MQPIKTEVEQAARQVNAHIRELNTDLGEPLRNKVAGRFAQGKTHWLWEHLDNDISIQHDDAWQWIGDLVGDSVIILFFNSEDDRTMFEIPGSALVPILEESYGFEFYVTNVNADF